jgi:hypothetical protein
VELVYINIRLGNSFKISNLKKISSLQIHWDVILKINNKINFHIKIKKKILFIFYLIYIIFCFSFNNIIR